MKQHVRWALAFGVVGSLVVACATSEEVTFSGSGGADASAGDDGGVAFADGNVEFGDGSLGGCKRRTCADVGANCGPLADGCGGLVDCGTCAAPKICGA